MNNNEINENSYTICRDHAWSWFEFHAKQRIDVFRLYLGICAILIAGYSAAVANKFYAISLFTSALLIFASLMFFALDRRNIQLISIAESYLTFEQRRLSEIIKNEKIRFLDLASEQEDLGFGKVSYSKILMIFFSSIALLSFLMIIYSIILMN